MKKSKGVAIIAIILACLIGLGYYTSTIMSATSTSQKKLTTRRKPKVLNLVLIFPVVCPLLTGSRIRIHPRKISMIR